LKILLDENFPLALDRRLTADGEDVEHIITLAGAARPTGELGIALSRNTSCS
jgi:hypothetical protein